MSEPKYSIGETVLYDGPHGRTLIRITGNSISFFDPLLERFGVGSETYYSGLEVKIAPTKLADVPLAPKPVTGANRIPEHYLRPLGEEIWA